MAAFAQSLDSSDAPRTVRVVVIVPAGHPPPEPVLDGLAREIIDVEVAAVGDVLSSAPDPDRAIALVWARVGESSELYEQIAAWASQPERSVALIGCCERGDNADAERALAAGFDDFVAGRCSTRELAARLRALHRRIYSPAPRRSWLRYGRLALDQSAHQLYLGQRAVALSSTELGVVAALIAAGGHALTRAEILDAAWGDGNLEVSERAVDNVVLRLRRKLGEAGIIETVRGVGFRLAGGRSASTS